ncbi:hypothetical protein O181_009645 [Austropuccinia psidii MF-1]|uniref:Tf2-1-like SH3-like domain-containing protein n=1 Tax=Austropuccinia psidii MF-1 TaxID=1389203 RepID=A0A9Q3GK43_9BASI|nr:hypothetical protein [Austropuccinia psidii MF-1]
MLKTACDIAEKCIGEAKLYSKKRYAKGHQETDFNEGEQVLISALDLNNPKGPSKMRNSFLGPITIIRLLGKNAVEIRLTDEFSRKHPVFPVSLVKAYHKRDDETFTQRKKIFTYEKLFEEDYSPGPVKKIIKARKI